MIHNQNFEKRRELHTPVRSFVARKCPGFPSALFENLQFANFAGFPNDVNTSELGPAGFPTSARCRLKGLDNFVYVKLSGSPNQLVQRKSMSLIASRFTADPQAASSTVPGRR